MQNRIIKAYLFHSDTQDTSVSVTRVASSMRLATKHISPKITQPAQEMLRSWARLEDEILKETSGQPITDGCLLCVAAPRRRPWKSVWMSAWKPWISSSTTTSARVWRGCSQGNRPAPQPRGFPPSESHPGPACCCACLSRVLLLCTTHTHTHAWVSGGAVMANSVGWYTLDMLSAHGGCTEAYRGR